MKVFAIFFVLLLVIAVLLILFVIVNGARLAARASREHRADALAPVVERPAMVTAKRTEVRGGGESRAVTEYYATFEFADRERVEFPVTAGDYGLLAERDQGVLTTQGAAYRAFRRSGLIQDRPR